MKWPGFVNLFGAWFLLALIPLIILTTAATVIASQAVISGAFSLTRQAVQLGYLPRELAERVAGLLPPLRQLPTLLASITDSENSGSTVRKLRKNWYHLNVDPFTNLFGINE